ncbi:hypothetical protein J6590_048146 [Homalodisca vitripennis]|nr:hypothetical protein J6590_048146 [Homalodisca vitripennis]
MQEIQYFILGLRNYLDEGQLRVETLLRKQPTMSTKEDYYTVYESVGEVRKLGDEWSLVNTKCLSSRFRNVDHISEKKRIFLKKGKAVVEKTTGRREFSTVKVKSTDHFRFQSDTEQFISLQKKGWLYTKCFSTPLEPVSLGHAIKASKKKDVESLLKLMYGDEWKNNTNLSWYKIILEETPECHEIEGEEEECECDCLEPDVGLHI